MTASEHRSGVEGIEHFTSLPGGKHECWCMEECCYAYSGEGEIFICVCPDCAHKVPDDSA